MLSFVVFGASMLFASVYWTLRTTAPARIANGGSTAAHRRSVITFGVAVPLATIALYALLGRPDALTPVPDPARAMATERTARLADRLETQRDDVAGLRLLARSYDQLSRRDEAVAIRRRLVALDPDDPDALIDLAEAVSSTQGSSDVGEPVALARRALGIDAANGRALAVVANEAAQRSDFTTAIDAWDRLLQTVEPDSDVGRSLRLNIGQARTSLAEAAQAESLATRP